MTSTVHAEVVAVVVAVVGDTPCVLTVPDGPALPRGPLSEHGSLQASLRRWVEEQTGHRVGFVEQLYTFADHDRGLDGTRSVTVAYLGLTRLEAPDPSWRPWYSFFPWEDRRAADSEEVCRAAGRAAQAWSRARPQQARRAAACFGLEGRAWTPEWCLQRYELLYEAGALPECGVQGPWTAPGERMAGHDRRIVATGIARLRSTIQYRPVVFELMPDEFTLGGLQRCVEALAGQGVHKQNFRRLIAQQDLVEETGRSSHDTGGRPARLVRFRGEVVDGRREAGTKLPVPRSR